MRKRLDHTNTNGSPSANSTLTMITEAKPIERNGWGRPREDQTEISVPCAMQGRKRERASRSVCEGVRVSAWFGN